MDALFFGRGDMCTTIFSSLILRIPFISTCKAKQFVLEIDEII